MTISRLLVIFIKQLTKFDIQYDEILMFCMFTQTKRSRVTNGVDWPWMDECSRDSNLSWSGDSTRMNQSSMPQGGGEERSVSSCSKTGRRSVPKKVDAKADSADVLKEKFASIARVSKVTISTRY